MRKLLFIGITIVFFCACTKKHVYDASGTFEVDEVIVSSEMAGKIKALNVEEGSILKAGDVVGYIDSIPLRLQKEQVEATIDALHQKTLDVKPEIRLLEDQVHVQEAQLANAILERNRTQRLVEADAATTKQLDDQNSQIDVLKRQIAVNRQQMQVQRNTTGTQNSTVLSEYRPLKKSVAQIQDQLTRSNIVNPINGTVLTKYAFAGEVTTAGKALYKIGDVSVITLRAYITGTQLAQVKLDQQLTVLVDSSKDSYRKYTGTITWISDKAEFTPKTIQTKDERANLVYAIKIKVKNDGYLKIGMYGEVKF